MKFPNLNKLRAISMALAFALLAGACSDDSDNTNPGSSGASNRFSASVGMPGATQESLKSAQTTTKVNLVNNTSNRNLLYETWADGDQIALFFINDDGTIIPGKKVTISNISSDRKSCYFEGEIPEEVSTAFTLVGVVGMDDVKVSEDKKQILASAEPRPFKANNDDDKIPMMFQYKVEARDPSRATTITAIFERVGTIEHVYFQNKSRAATSIQNVEMVPVKAGAPAWYHTAGTNQIPQVDLLTGDVATVPGTPKTSATTATYVRSGATQSFIKWVMPTKEIEGKQKPEVKIEVTTNSEKITSFNTNKIPDYSYNIKVQKQRIYTEVAQLYSDGKLAFTHPYIIQTDGGTSAGTAITSIKNQSGVKHMELGNNTYAFSGLTESKWFEGLTKVISYGSEITTLNYQNATKFAIEAQLTPRITSLEGTFRNAQSDTYPGIENWDTQYVTNMRYTFAGTYSRRPPVDIHSYFNQDISEWDVSNVTDMQGMFYRTSTFNQDISGWSVSNVESMQSMFYEATAFNNNDKPLNWAEKTSKVKNMANMFYSATTFNQDVSGWSVSNVEYMQSMFQNATAFNNNDKPLNWAEKTSKVENMANMFYSATTFNQDVSGWNVSNVEYMQSMFQSATAFNNGGKPINWGGKTGNVTTMRNMFYYATAFNQDVSGWDVSKVTSMESMFRSATAFNQDISGWCVQKISTMPRGFDGSAFSIGTSSFRLSPAGFYGKTDLYPKWGTCPGK